MKPLQIMLGIDTDLQKEITVLRFAMDNKEFVAFSILVPDNTAKGQFIIDAINEKVANETSDKKRRKDDQEG